jgi:hypothetical protein
MRTVTIVAAALATLALAAFAAPAQAKLAAPGGQFPSGSVPGPPAAGAAKSGWSIAPTPNPRAPTGQLLFGTCATASSCTAVGTYVKASGVGATLAERTDGSGWRIQPTPNPPGAKVSSLAGVACTTPSACTAVGDSITGSGIARTLVERWDGRRWGIQPTPNPAGAPQAFLIAVACTSSSSCTSVGYAATSSGTPVSLAERWDGARWQIEPTPNPSGAQFSVLNGVSCTAPSACTAVGQTSRGILAERWDGSGWRIQQTPNPPSGGGGLLGVACTSPSSCTASGFSNSGTLAERWDGARWQIQPTPNPSGAQFAFLNGIGCSSGSACSAVGAYLTSSGAFVTMAERWNGSEWSTQPTPNPAGALGDFLFAVACPSSSDCTALGYAHGSGTPQTLAQRWNGTRWLLQPTPNPTGGSESTFGGIACPARSTCFAAGSGANAALVERWNGTAWRIQPVPTLPGAGLSAVSCSSPSACISVGVSDSGTLAERWDGDTWTILPTPNPPGGGVQSGLLSVSCLSPSACLAAGAYFTAGSQSKTLAEWWNGKEWAILPTPNPAGAVQSFFNGVNCTSPSACTATGEQHSASGIAHTLAERWDGATWTIQPTPNPAKVQFASLGGVACTGPSACVAVGGSDRGSLVERWDGTAWQIQPAPTPPGGGLLNGVVCPAPAACTAVGFTFTSSGGMILAERWNGTAWHIQPTPLLAAAHDVSLPAVACPERTACTAVGGYENDGPTSVTLAERWPGDTGAGQPAARGPAAPGRAGADCALPLLVSFGFEAALQRLPSLRPGSRMTISTSLRPTSPGPPSLTWCRVR